MKLLIHDLSPDAFASFFPTAEALVHTHQLDILSDNGTIHHCVGCFKCWTKTPGTCVLRDGYEHIGQRFSKADEIIVLSQSIYGTYSPFVRNVLERSISYQLPYFTRREGETHHRRRYPSHELNYRVCFYGMATKEEQTSAKGLVKANAVNLAARQYSATFYVSDE